MKYKLININTKEEHLCDKVIIDGFDYYVSEECDDLGGWHIDLEFNSLSNPSRYNVIDTMKKVISTNNPNIDVPKVVDGAERLAWNYTTEKYPDINDEDSSQEELNIWNSYWEGFQAGYNKSQETHPFSEEDMIEFANWKGKEKFEWNIKYNNWTSQLIQYSGCVYTTKELLQLWKEQQSKIVYYNE